MRISKLSVVIGVFLILIGTVVSSSTLVEFLRAKPLDLVQQGIKDQLLLGATLFKIGLVILGLLAIAFRWMPLWKSENQSVKPLPDPHKRVSLGILAVILVAATVLRLYGLNYGLWFDEILTYVNYMKMPFGEIISTYDSQNQHFLYSILAHISFEIFGESVWSLRLPAVLFGVGSIWVLYLLGCQISSTLEALLSAALLTFSYHHIWFSQNARGYTGILFWTIIASWLLVRGLREGRPHLWVLYAMTSALGVYTHMTMLFIVIGHFIIYLMALYARRKEVQPERWTGFFFGFCLAGLFTFTLYALVLPQIFGEAFWEGASTSVVVWKNPVWTVLEVIKSMKIGLAGGVVAVAAFLVLATGLFGFMRKDPLAIQLLIIPALVSIIAIIGMGHPVFPRTFFFTIGFSVLIVVRGTMLLGTFVTRLTHLKSMKPVTVGSVFCISLVVLSAMSVPRAYAPKQDYQGALLYIEEQKKPGDIIVTVGLTTFPYKNLYKVDWEEVETVEDLNTKRSLAKRTWLLYTMPLHLEYEYPEIMDSIKHDFKVVKRFYGTLGGGTIFVCLSDIHPS